MKWITFTGARRLTNKEVEDDVRQAVRDCISNGYGITTGAATGVDYYCMDECVKNNYINKLRVFIPSDIDHCISNYYKDWGNTPIAEKEILDLENSLKFIQENNPSSILEMKHSGGTISQERYELRHNEEIVFSDEVYAFQVNNGPSTQDIIDKARACSMLITHKKYTIAEDK